MKKHEADFPIVKMSKALCVGKSGYDAWKKRPLSRRARQQQELVVMTHIKVSFRPVQPKEIL